MIDLYENKLKSAEYIGKLFGCSEWTIRKNLRENSIKIRSKFAFSRKHTLDLNVFEKINTEHKAYFLGLMYADGNVHISKKGYQFHLTLHVKDILLVNAFKSFLKASISPYYHAVRNHIGLFVNSKKICYDLIKLGCTERKSLTLQFPNFKIIPKYLMGHFLRGYFDGDGSVTFTQKNARIEARIISSLSFCEGYMQVLSDHFDISKFYFYENKIKLSVMGLPYTTVGIGNFHDISNFYKLLYKGATVFLPRKKEVFDRYLLYKQDLQNKK